MKYVLNLEVPGHIYLKFVSDTEENREPKNSNFS
jgi:hypothetical protein